MCYPVSNTENNTSPHQLGLFSQADLAVLDERLFLWCLTVPELLGGKQLSATVIDLSPWVEYEFRVLATNGIGTGEPSKPSKKTRTKEMRTYPKLLTLPLHLTVTVVSRGFTLGQHLNPLRDLLYHSFLENLVLSQGHTTLYMNEFSRHISRVWWSQKGFRQSITNTVWVCLFHTQASNLKNTQTENHKTWFINFNVLQA